MISHALTIFQLALVHMIRTFSRSASLALNNPLPLPPSTPRFNNLRSMVKVCVMIKGQFDRNPAYQDLVPWARHHPRKTTLQRPNDHQLSNFVVILSGQRIPLGRGRSWKLLHSVHNRSWEPGFFGGAGPHAFLYPKQVIAVLFGLNETYCERFEGDVTILLVLRRFVRFYAMRRRQLQNAYGPDANGLIHGLHPQRGFIINDIACTHGDFVRICKNAHVHLLALLRFLGDYDMWD
jgi:hypothetical protein